MTMLGYTKEDINEIQEAILRASAYLPPAPHKLKDGLEKAQSFFDGLWAEGYFD